MGPVGDRCRGGCGSGLTGKFAENPCRRTKCFGRMWKSWKRRRIGHGIWLGGQRWWSGAVTVCCVGGKVRWRMQSACLSEWAMWRCDVPLLV